MTVKTIYTIGHSSRETDKFIAMLNSFEIEMLADIRRYPGSRKYPQFNAENLQISLANAGIGYVHIEALGGRRKPGKESRHTVWRHPAFRGYADYMCTPEFKKGILELEKIALLKTTVIMCSEAVWWSCHRSMVSDYLKARGWQVLHIMDVGKVTEHPYTGPASVTDGKLEYDSRK